MDNKEEIWMLQAIAGEIYKRDKIDRLYPVSYLNHDPLTVSIPDPERISILHKFKSMDFIRTDRETIGLNDYIFLTSSGFLKFMDILLDKNRDFILVSKALDDGILSRNDITNAIGSKRVVVDCILGYMKEEGYISVDYDENDMIYVKKITSDGKHFIDNLLRDKPEIHLKK